MPMTTIARTIRKNILQMFRARKDTCSVGSVPLPPGIFQEKAVNLSPVLVYQMGRVGSISLQSSILNAYQALALNVPVYHAHYMNNYEEIESRARIDLLDPEPLIRGLQSARALHKQLVGSPEAPRLKIVCLVRDIIARNVSTFFYALPQFIPDWEQRLERETLTIEYLHEVFLSKNSYQLTAANWFDEQLKPVFDMDVYAAPFPRESGYKIYSSQKADLLVIRLENLKHCADQAIYEFLGLHNFRLLKVNTGDERNTGELQRLFKSKPLPREYVESKYRSKLARHFYSDAELGAFTRYWTEIRES